MPEADPQKIKNQLLEYELIAEDLSGDTLMVEISAKSKQNLDKLVESIVLQAEILDLKTDYESKATAVVLESKIDIGRGPVANIIITSGTLKKVSPQLKFTALEALLPLYHWQILKGKLAPQLYGWKVTKILIDFWH